MKQGIYAVLILSMLILTLGCTSQDSSGGEECTGKMTFCSDANCKVFHEATAQNPSGSYTCDKTSLCEKLCGSTSWSACSGSGQCCDAKPGLSCESMSTKSECLAAGCTYGPPVFVCTEGESKPCTTDQNCSGLIKCVDNAWGVCADYADDGCPVLQPVRCVRAEDCFDGNDCTTDWCANPGQSSSYCINAKISGCEA